MNGSQMNIQEPQLKPAELLEEELLGLSSTQSFIESTH